LTRTLVRRVYLQLPIPVSEMRSGLPRYIPTSAHYSRQVLLFQGQTCSHFRSFTTCGDALDRYGRVGAGRPLLGRPYPPLRTVLATCHRTRLSPYLWLAMISFGECAIVKLVMALGTEPKGFPPSCCHHVLPQCLSLCHVFQLPQVVHLKCPLCRSAIFTVFAVQPLDKLRAAERPHVNVGEQVNP